MKKNQKNQKKKKKNNTTQRSIIKKSMRESSLQEIGDALGLTRMRICQLEKVILAKIKNTRSLEEFEIEWEARGGKNSAPLLILLKN